MTQVGGPFDQSMDAILRGMSAERERTLASPSDITVSQPIAEGVKAAVEKASSFPVHITGPSVGRLFGMKVYVDPDLPPDGWHFGPPEPEEVMGG